MNQYLLFMYYNEASNGGWDDFLGDFDNLSACYEEIDRLLLLFLPRAETTLTYDWHIVDLDSGEIIDRD